MKRYSVVLTLGARLEAIDAATFIQQSSAERAMHWLTDLDDAIQSLRTMPERCRFAEENVDIDVEMRVLHFQSYRIIFHIEEAAGIVRVYRIRHGARRTVTTKDET